MGLFRRSKNALPVELRSSFTLENIDVKYLKSAGGSPTFYVGQEAQAQVEFDAIWQDAIDAANKGEFEEALRLAKFMGPIDMRSFEKSLEIWTRRVHFALQAGLIEEAYEDARHISIYCDRVQDGSDLEFHRTQAYFWMYVAVTALAVFPLSEDIANYVIVEFRNICHALLISSAPIEQSLDDKKAYRAAFSNMIDEIGFVARSDKGLAIRICDELVKTCSDFDGTDQIRGMLAKTKGEYDIQEY